MKSPTLLPKGEYAAHRGVSAAAVAQYIAKGYLDEALVLPDGSQADRKDRGAKIDRDKADELLRRRLNTNQVLGAGKPLPAKPPASLDANDVRAETEVSASPVAAPRPTDDTADRLAALKLERAERENETERRQFAEQQGRYTPTAAVQREAGRVMSEQLASFEAWLLDALIGKIADASVASDGKPLDRRALKLLAKGEYRSFRVARAEAARHRRDAAPAFLPDPEEAPVSME